MTCKVYILVEGQTEQTFVRDVLAPHLLSFNVFATAVIVKTRQVPNGQNHKGGFVPYPRIKKQIQKLLNDSSVNIVTTMFDYYGLPDNFPGKNNIPKGECCEIIRYLENEWFNDIGHKRFFPYLQVHEFEALLFSSPAHIAEAFPETESLSQLIKIKNMFKTPEKINDNPQTAPSGRLKNIFSSYEKILHGPLIANRIGLDTIKQECVHFSHWIERLEKSKIAL